jgi:hypothetical protein
LISLILPPAQGFQIVKPKPGYGALALCSRRPLCEAARGADHCVEEGGDDERTSPIGSPPRLSRGGARLVFSGSTPIPDVFDLTIRENGETRRVRVVWRDGMQAGVAYESAAPPFAPEATRQIRKLEADRNALARRLAQLTR